MEEVIDHLSDGGIAVVLSDWRYLQCIWCPPQVRELRFTNSWGRYGGLLKIAQVPQKMGKSGFIT